MMRHFLSFSQVLKVLTFFILFLFPKAVNGKCNTRVVTDPTQAPTLADTSASTPTGSPTELLALFPTTSPSLISTTTLSPLAETPTYIPSSHPSVSPVPNVGGSFQPTLSTSDPPSSRPSIFISYAPTVLITAPSVAPTDEQSDSPTSNSPLTIPSAPPSSFPTQSISTPTSITAEPSSITAAPSSTYAPTLTTAGNATVSTTIPSAKPTEIPATNTTENQPSVAPTTSPTLAPTLTSPIELFPTVNPTEEPTIHPTTPSTLAPTIVPTLQSQFSFIPSSIPYESPTSSPTKTFKPTVVPTWRPSSITRTPSLSPTVFTPTMVPNSIKPTATPSSFTPTLTQSPSAFPTTSSTSILPTSSSPFVSLSPSASAQTTQSPSVSITTEFPSSLSVTNSPSISKSPSTSQPLNLISSSEPTVYPTSDDIDTPTDISINPTAVPSFSPNTFSPTALPNTEVEISMEQVISVTKVLITSTEVETAFSYTVAASVQYLTSDSVEIESVVNTSSSEVSTSGYIGESPMSAGFLRVAINKLDSVYYVKFVYSIRFFVESLGYSSSVEAVDDVVVQLKAAVSSGYFAQMLQYYATVFHADSALLTATVTGVSMRSFKVISSDQQINSKDQSFPLYGKIILPLGIFILITFFVYVFWERINDNCQKIPNSRYKSLFGENTTALKNSEDNLSERTSHALEQQLVNLLLNNEDDRPSISQDIAMMEQDCDDNTQADPVNIAIDLEQNEETIQNLVGNATLSTPEKNNDSHCENVNLHSQDELVVITSPIIARQKSKLPQVADFNTNAGNQTASPVSPAKQRTGRIKRLKSTTSNQSAKRSSIKELISQVKSQAQQDGDLSMPQPQSETTNHE